VQFLMPFVWSSSWLSSHSSRSCFSSLGAPVVAAETTDSGASFSPFASDGSSPVETSFFEFSPLHDLDDVLPRANAAKVCCPTAAARSVSAAAALVVSEESTRESFPDAIAVLEGHGEAGGADGMYLLSGPRI